VSNAPCAIYKKQNYWWPLGVLKILWLGFEIYHFYGVSVLGQYLWQTRFPQDWRYTPVLHWFLLFSWFTFMSIGTSIVIKWILIGKRRPGVCNVTLCRRAADWVADWHFQVSLQIFSALFYASRIWNFVLTMHGMDIDFASKLVTPEIFLPSKVDLVRVRESFIGTVFLDTENAGMYHQVDINQSSIAISVHLGGPRSLEVSRMVMPPLTCVSKSICQDVPDPRFPNNYSLCQALELEVLVGIRNCVFVGSAICYNDPTVRAVDEHVW